jgi:hypothetical protein
MENGLMPIDVPKLFAVIVLYKTLPRDSISLQTLLASFKELPPGSARLTTLLYDNTPGGQNIASIPPGVLYECGVHNTGLAGAYNRALELAEADGSQWLLTLDQDTSLPLNFLPRVTGLAAEHASDSTIAAIVPQIIADGRRVSPNWFQFGAIARSFSAGYVGIPRHATWAFNSASTIRVSALRQIGGYAPEFWLDNADSYLYLQLHRYSKKVFVAGDIQVEHEFSMLDIKNRMTPDRYRNILLSGGAFWDLYMGRLASIEHTVRLIVRLFYKHPRNGDGPEIVAATREALKRRLFHSKKFRLERWREDVQLRLEPNTELQKSQNRRSS